MCISDLHVLATLGGYQDAVQQLRGMHVPDRPNVDITEMVAFHNLSQSYGSKPVPISVPRLAQHESVVVSEMVMLAVQLLSSTIDKMHICTACPV